MNLEDLGLKAPRKIKIGGNMKMKRLHWDSIHASKIPQTIWQGIDDSTVKYNAQHFELNFQVRVRKPMKDKKPGASKKAATGEIRHFASKKRTQGVLIGLKSLSLSNEQLRQVLHNMDEQV